MACLPPVALAEVRAGRAPLRLPHGAGWRIRTTAGGCSSWGGGGARHGHRDRSGHVRARPCATGRAPPSGSAWSAVAVCSNVLTRRGSRPLRSSPRPATRPRSWDAGSGGKPDRGRTGRGRGVRRHAPARDLARCAASSPPSSRGAPDRRHSRPAWGPPKTALAEPPISHRKPPRRPKRQPPREKNRPLQCA